MSGKKRKVDNPTAVIGEMAKELYGKYGKEVFPVFTPVLMDYGLNVGARLKKKLADASFPDRIRIWLDAGIKAGLVEIVEQGDKFVKTKGLFCPLNLDGSGRIVCENLMKIDEGIVTALADGRKVSLAIEKTVAQGDPYCLVTFSINE